MAADHLRAKGLDEYEANRLATSLGEKLNIRDPSAVDALLEKYTSLDTPLSFQDWCSCFCRCNELLTMSPAAVKIHLDTLWDVMDVTDEGLVHTLLKTPSLLVHDPQDIGSKVQALQAVMALPEEEATAQLIIERFARHPTILARSVDALESQLDGLARLLGTDIQRAARLSFKVPALAAQSNEELEGHMELLSKLLGLETEQVQTLVLRQPSLLARTTEGLQAKIDAYTELFGPEHVGTALAGAPQLLTMKVEAVTARHELLQQLVILVPAWETQLAEASKEVVAVWLCSSEKKLRRLEIAATNRKLSRMQLYRLLSNSESRWINDMAGAGLGPDGKPTGGQSGAAADDGTAAEAAHADTAAGAKPKRPRGGRRERERKERIAARKAAAGDTGTAAAAGPSSSAAAAPATAAVGSDQEDAAAATAKPKRPRGGRREREKRERVARRLAAGEAPGGGSSQGQQQQQQHHDDFGADYEPHHVSHGAGEGSTVATAGSSHQGSSHQGNGVGGGAVADRPRRTRGGRREREKRERREARAAAASDAVGSSEGGQQQQHGSEDFGAGFGRSVSGGVGNASAAADDAEDGDGSGGAGGARHKRAVRGGRREREKRERLAARLAAATATAAATAALPQEA